jgi:thiamine pyrophosphate-dependent acetolactate synthase large subunit-like protein
VADAGELPEAIEETLAEPGPALLHVPVAPEADCLPMFRPGGSAREMVYERRSMSSTSAPSVPQAVNPAFS